MATGSVATVKPAGNAFTQDRTLTKFLIQNSQEITQQIAAGTAFPVNAPTINITPQNVGIIKRFIVELTGVVNNSGAGTATLSDNGVANAISNVTLYDLQNNLRINTTGLHLYLLSTMKRRRPFGAAAQWNTNNGSNLAQMQSVAPASWGIFQAPQTIATTANGTYRAVFEIPLAYSDDDLRGAVFANVVNTQMNLQITFNQNVFNGTGTGDNTYCMYTGQTGTHVSVAYVISQVFLDQLPTNQGQYVLPKLSLNTVYELKQTHFTSIGQGNDFPFPFTNFRDFFSVFIIYNNSGTNAGRVFGTDINYWSMSTANFSNLFKYGPLYNQLLTREQTGADLPAGEYYFNFRRNPVWTTQFGNQQINLNASTAGTNAYADAMWEDMAIQNTLTGGQSLGGNN